MMLCVARVRRAGFTLIEIMIVIAIIAILAGIAIPNIREAREETKLAVCRRNILTIVNALNQALIRHTRSQIAREGTLGEDDISNADAFLINHGYLDKMPRCPSFSRSRRDIDYVVRVNEPYVSTRLWGYVTCSFYRAKHKVGGEDVNPLYDLGSDGPDSGSTNASWSSTGWRE